MCCDLFIFRAGSNYKYWCRLPWESSSTMGDSDDLMSFLMATSSGMPAAPLSASQASKSAEQAVVQQATPQRKEPDWFAMRRASSTSLGATPKRDRGFEHVGRCLETPPSSPMQNLHRQDSMKSAIEAVSQKLENQLKISGKKSEPASSSEHKPKKETSKKESPDKKNTSPKSSKKNSPDMKNTTPKASKNSSPDMKNTTPKASKDSACSQKSAGSEKTEDEIPENLFAAHEGEEEEEQVEDPEVDSDGEEYEDEGLVFEVKPIKRPAAKTGPKKACLVLVMCGVLRLGFRV